MDHKTLSIIIPVYNEEKTILNVLNELKHLVFSKLEKEVIVVDDGSTDRTKTILEKNKLEKKLENFPFVEKVYPSDSNFLLVKVTNANKLYKYLLDNGIVVRNRSQIKGCEECLRITVGTLKQNNLLINVLKRI